MFCLLHGSGRIQDPTASHVLWCRHVFIRTIPCLSYYISPNCSLSFHLCVPIADTSPRATLLRIKSRLCSQSFNGFRINSRSLTGDHMALSDINPCCFPLHGPAPAPLRVHSLAALCSPHQPALSAFMATCPSACTTHPQGAYVLHISAPMSTSSKEHLKGHVGGSVS